MKQLFFFLLLATIQDFESHRNSGFRVSENCKSILDSADVLVESGEFSIDWKLQKPDAEKQFRIEKWFEKRTFAELTCLLESNNRLHKFYGYVLASMFFKDSLKNSYSYMLSDTTQVQFNMEDTLVDSKKTIGELLQELEKQIANEKEEMSKKPAIEKQVTAFIKEYANYPETYKPIAFPYFSTNTNSDGRLMAFNIRHEYKIENNKEKMVKVVSAFVFDPKLNVNVIEQDSSAYISSYPPHLKDWFRDYGRKLNRNDSTLLKLIR